MNQNISETIVILERFNRKADKLLRSEFVKIMFHSKTGLSILGKQNSLTIKVQEPSETQTDAFILTLRFFIQQNENISFEKMNSLYKKGNLNQNYTTAFLGAVKQINDSLDSSPSIRLIENNETLTNRKILEIFLYGDLAHANKLEKVDTFQRWFNAPPFFAMAKNEFYLILAFLLKEINYLKLINETVLTEIKN